VTPRPAVHRADPTVPLRTRGSAPTSTASDGNGALRWSRARQSGSAAQRALWECLVQSCVLPMRELRWASIEQCETVVADEPESARGQGATSATPGSGRQAGPGPHHRRDEPGRPVLLRRSSAERRGYMRLLDWPALPLASAASAASKTGVISALASHTVAHAPGIGPSSSGGAGRLTNPSMRQRHSLVVGARTPRI
jgi:hypothetical protein